MAYITVQMTGGGDLSRSLRQACAERRLSCGARVEWTLTTTRPYAVRCRACNRSFEDDGLLLACPAPHEPALLVADYPDRRFLPDDSADDLFRYDQWLPTVRRLAGAGRAVVYRSDRLARATGLRDLWIAFNGYWPERGASLPTGTFKDLEAWTVLGRLLDSSNGTIVVASAGNTAAAFAQACAACGVPCVLVVPESGLSSLELGHPADSSVKIVALAAPADYSDAIALAGWLAGLDGYYAEGGVRNIGRRAGLGTVMLGAAEAIGRLPDFYFQAVGSGAGAIGAFEMAERLVDDGSFGERAPRLMLSQNLPFAPLYDAWRAGSRRFAAIDAEEARRRIGQVSAPVLSNRQPPYAVHGGVYDVLTRSRGDMLAVDNASALAASRLFEECEGIDIEPAAGVALASLIQAERAGRVSRDDCVLLNVTGGGRQRRRSEQRLAAAQPALRLGREEIERDDLLERVAIL